MSRAVRLTVSGSGYGKQIPVDSAKTRICFECQKAPATRYGTCSSCRAKIVREGREADIRLDAVLKAREQRMHNYRIIDENGVEVWAAELAKRYRAETQPSVPVPLWIYR